MRIAGFAINFDVYSQLRSKLARSTTLLALTSLTPAVAALTLAAVTTVATATAEGTSLTLALTEHSTGRSMRSLLLDVGSGDDLGGEVKPFAEVVKTLGGQGVVVVLPGELSLDIAAGSQGLASLDDKEVLGVDVGVLGKVEVLLSDEYALTEEVLKNWSANGIRLKLLMVSRSTSWIFLRSGLGINIVAVVLLGNRCWK